MATHTMTATYYLELADGIIREHQGAIVPVLKILAGITDSRGDPRIAALRKVILKKFYCETEDCKSHFEEFIADEDEDEDEVSQPSSLAS